MRFVSIQAKTKKRILESLYLAQFNALYLNLLQRRYERWDLILRIGIGVVGTSVAATAIGTKTVAWQVISGVTTIFATAVVPVLKWQRLIGRIEADRVKWIALKNAYENLWNDAEADGNWDAAAKEYKRIRKRDNVVEEGKGTLPKHAGLLRKARKQVCAVHGCSV